MEAPSPTIAEYAILPKTKSSPSLTRNTAMGALLCLVIALGIFTVIYLLDDTIKSSEDVEKMFGTMPLSVIPEGDIKGLNKRDESGRGKGGKNSKTTKAGAGGADAGK